MIVAIVAIALSVGIGEAVEGHAGHAGHPGHAGHEAHGEHGDHGKSFVPLHGGSAAEIDGWYIETVFTADGVRIYLYSADQAPQMMRKANGSLKMVSEGGTNREVPLVLNAPEADKTVVHFCPMHPEVVQMEGGTCDLCGGMVLFKQDYLYGSVDLSKAAPGSFSVQVDLSGLNGKNSDASFAVPFAMLSDSPGSMSGHNEHKHEGHSEHNHKHDH
jgi:Heavy metal binding domain